MRGPFALAVLRNLALLLALGLLPILTPAQQIGLSGGQGSIRQFDTADFLLTQNLLPPGEPANWQRVSLPDNWNVNLPGQGGHGWYRFEFANDAISEAVQAIYVPRASMNATVFLNGELIDNSFGLYENSVRNWNRPLLIQFLPKHLRPGRNELLIRVDAKADNMGGLSPIELGPVELLYASYQQRRFIQLEIPELSQIFIVLISLITFGLWLLLKDALYGYFTVASASYFVRAIEFSANDHDVAVGLIQMGVAALVCWFVIFLTLFSLRLFQANWPTVEKYLLWLAGAVAVVLLFVGDGPWSASVAFSLHVLALALGMVTLTVLFPRIRLIPLVESLPITAAGLITFALGLHDVLQRLGMISTNTPRLSHLGSPVLIATMSVILFSRYVKNVQLLEENNKNLEFQVTQKSAQLVDNLLVQLELQKNQAVMQEREIILREMHDGVGNFLSIALRAATRSEPDMALLKTALKNCMLDLRLMIDSLGESNSGADTLATVLGNLRYRMDPSLKAEGIHLVWEVQDINIATPLTPRNVLNLTRIFQEALTNVVKHSGANQATMRTDIVVHDDQHWVAITLSDNGTWRTPSSSTSHGLANMQKRAQQLGGVLRLVCTDRGSTVELLLSAHP